VFPLLSRCTLLTVVPQPATTYSPSLLFRYARYRARSRQGQAPSRLRPHHHERRPARAAHGVELGRQRQFGRLEQVW